MEINYLRLIYGLNIFNYFLVSVKECQTIILPEADRRNYSDCYLQPMLSSCDVNQSIIVENLRFGTKPNNGDCSAIYDISEPATCCLLETTDCTYNQESTIYYEHCNGRQFCVNELLIPNALNTSPNTCNITEYHIVTQYLHMDYFCVDGDRIGSMCDTIDIIQIHDKPFYIQNTGYPDPIPSSDTQCACSIESNACNATISIYFVHLELSGSSGICEQTLNITGTNSTDTFVCADNTYYSLNVSHTASTYLTMVFNNTATEDIGHFWIGFQGLGDLHINCPPRNQQFCLPKPEASTSSSTSRSMTSTSSTSNATPTSSATTPTTSTTTTESTTTSPSTTTTIPTTPATTPLTASTLTTTTFIIAPANSTTTPTTPTAFTTTPTTSTTTSTMITTTPTASTSTLLTSKTTPKTSTSASSTSTTTPSISTTTSTATTTTPTTSSTTQTTSISTHILSTTTPTTSTLMPTTSTTTTKTSITNPTTSAHTPTTSATTKKTSPTITATTSTMTSTTSTTTLKTSTLTPSPSTMSSKTSTTTIKNTTVSTTTTSIPTTTTSITIPMVLTTTASTTTIPSTTTSTPTVTKTTPTTSTSTPTSSIAAPSNLTMTQTTNITTTTSVTSTTNSTTTSANSTTIPINSTFPNSTTTSASSTTHSPISNISTTFVLPAAAAATEDDSSDGLIVVIVVSSMIVVAMVIVICCCCCRKASDATVEPALDLVNNEETEPHGRDSHEVVSNEETEPHGRDSRELINIEETEPHSRDSGSDDGTNYAIRTLAQQQDHITDPNTDVYNAASHYIRMEPVRKTLDITCMPEDLPDTTNCYPSLFDESTLGVSNESSGLCQGDTPVDDNFRINHIWIGHDYDEIKNIFRKNVNSSDV